MLGYSHHAMQWCSTDASPLPHYHNQVTAQDYCSAAKLTMQDALRACRATLNGRRDIQLTCRAMFRGYRQQ